VAGGLSSGLSRAASGTGAAMRASAPQLAGTVSVRVVRATGLLAADRGGTSDPYVVVQSAGGKKAKTSVKKRTLDPEWDETLELSVYDASAPLSFAVWDHDKVGTNDSLGAGEVLLGQCAPGAPTSLRVALSTQGAIEVVVTFSPAEPAVELRELTAAAAGATAAGAAGGASGARAARTAAMAREAATPQVVPAFASGAAPLSPASYLRRLVPFGGGSSAGQAAASSPEDSGSLARAV
jgi:Ca2+-dependent lipid-binding protein